MKFNELKNLVLNLSDEEKRDLSKALGYYKFEKFQKANSWLLKAENLASYLRAGYFDYTHTSATFVKKLAKIYGVDIENEFENALKFNDELKKYRQSYIYIDTDFKRTTEPIHMLACVWGHRYLGFDKNELCFKDLDKQLKYISDIIKTHYLKVQILPIFGKITGYKFVHLGASFSFDINAKLANKEIFESVAWLKF